MATFVIKIKYHWKVRFYFLIIWYLLKYESLSWLENLLKSSISFCLRTKRHQVLSFLLLYSLIQFSLSFNCCSFCSHCRSLESYIGVFLQLYFHGSCPQPPLVTMTNTLLMASGHCYSSSLFHIRLLLQIVWRDCEEEMGE